ncbi:MAG: hypothetical protein ACTSWR_04080, partial [Candidatus Helarchaeota archaeon]
IEQFDEFFAYPYSFKRLDKFTFFNKDKNPFRYFIENNIIYLPKLKFNDESVIQGYMTYLTPTDYEKFSKFQLGILNAYHLDTIITGDESTEIENYTDNFTDYTSESIANDSVTYSDIVFNTPGVVRTRYKTLAHKPIYSDTLNLSITLNSITYNPSYSSCSCMRGRDICTCNDSEPTLPVTFNLPIDGQWHSSNGCPNLEFSANYDNSIGRVTVKIRSRTTQRPATCTTPTGDQYNSTCNWYPPDGLIIDSMDITAAYSYEKDEDLDWYKNPPEPSENWDQNPYCWYSKTNMLVFDPTARTKSESNAWLSNFGWAEYKIDYEHADFNLIANQPVDTLLKICFVYDTSSGKYIELKNNTRDEISKLIYFDGSSENELASFTFFGTGNKEYIISVINNVITIRINGNTIIDNLDISSYGFTTKHFRICGNAYVYWHPGNDSALGYWTANNVFIKSFQMTKYININNLEETRVYSDITNFLCKVELSTKNKFKTPIVGGLKILEV